MVKHDEILDALSSRSNWESKQETWYKLRHEGLRRRMKPYPNAADMNFPLTDMLIEKLKPYYIQQVFATEAIASFAGLSLELAEHANAAAQWFDFQLKQESNFEDEIVTAVDTMLMRAKSIVKVYWDVDQKRLAFDAIDPMFLIVPAWTKKLVDADWIVHVKHYSKAAYKRVSEYRQDEGFVASICGKGEESERATAEKYEREGLTHGKEDQIVIWEVYHKNEAGDWWIKTYSPNRPKEKVREDFGLPYHLGIFAKKVPPFGELNAEIKDKGFYSARGVAERAAPFQAALCKDWNTQKDYQTLTTTPMFTAPNGLPSGQQNVRMVPGQILPFPVEALQFPPMPMDIAMQMNQTRLVAEQLQSVPDFGAQQNGGKTRTATEMNLVGSVHGQNIDLRARIFRRELGQVLQLAWALCLQYAREKLKFYYLDELAELPEEALSDKYLIEPSGSGDNVNRQLVLQKAVARKQMFTGNPNIDQRELDKSVLEADDPRLVRKLLLNAGTQQAEQIEDQAQELSIMLMGFPAQVRPTDDDASHVQSILGFINRRNTLGEPLTPEQMRLIAQHAEQHMQAMKKRNPQGYAQIAPQAMPLVQQLMALAQQIEQIKQQQGPAPAQQPIAAGGAPAVGQMGGGL